MTRFRTALLIAVGLHGCLIVFCSWQRRGVSPARLADGPAELQIELAPLAPAMVAEHGEPPVVEEAEVSAPSRTATTTATLRQQSAPARTMVAASAELEPTRRTLGAPESGGATESPAAPVSAALLASPNAPTAARIDTKIDLGLDGHFLRSEPQTQAAPLHKRRANGSELSNQLNRSLADNSDVKRAQAKGNALIGALNAAVRQSGAPENGNALIRVTFNASGELSGVELLRGAANDWAAAIQAFRAQTKGRRVELPSGARGLRVTYDVSTKLQLPSGRAVGTGPIGVKRPSLAPNGLTLGGAFDVADFADRTTRIASSRIVVEEVL